MQAVVEPLFGVVDSFVRFEFQHRGTLHGHILLWLADAPDIASGVDLLGYSEESQARRAEIYEFYRQRVNLQAERKDDAPPLGEGEKKPTQRTEEDVAAVNEEHGDSTDLHQLINQVQEHMPCDGNKQANCHKGMKGRGCRFAFPRKPRAQPEIAPHPRHEHVPYLHAQRAEKDKYMSLISCSFVTPYMMPHQSFRLMHR